MPLQSSGQISLNDLHVEAGGTSGTQCSMNDSDIRGLISASANSQMTFSSFYGASSQLWSTNVTLGNWSFKAIQSYGYGLDLGQTIQGSISDNTIDFINNGNATAELISIYNGTSWSFLFRARNIGTDTTNTGFTSLTAHNTTFTRTSATSFNYDSSTNVKQWTWSASGNAWGTTTTGTTRTVVFN